MIKHSSEIKAGKYFHVYGYRGMETTIEQMSELDVIGITNKHPLFGKKDNQLWLEYTKNNTQIDHSSLTDLGIDIERPYNANRLFATREEATHYIWRLQNDMLTYDEIKNIARGDILGQTLTKLIKDIGNMLGDE